MPCSRKMRPTICPMRPKPATMTGASEASMVSNSGSGARRNRGIRKRSDSANRIGVASIEAAEINVANAARSGDKAPTATAAPSSTKLNSLACGNARAKRIALDRSHRATRARTKAIAAFTSSSARGGLRQNRGPRHGGVQIGRHADGDEEEAEQGVLERRDVGLQFVPVFGIGQHHAGQERAERRRQSGGGGEQRGAGDDEQSGGGEQFRGTGAADGAEQRLHQEAAAGQDQQDRGDAFAHLEPGQRAGHRVAAGQQRHQRDQRNERQILEQQHGEGVAAGGGGQQISLPQQRQHDGGRGQRQADAEHGGAGQGHAGGDRAGRPDAAPVTTTCAEPRPNTARRMIQRRRGRSSRPIRNSSITTPSEATLAICSTSVTRRSPDGPMTRPAIR